MNNAKAGFHSVDYMTTPTTARRRLHQAPGSYNLDELTFDPSLTFLKEIYSGKMRVRSKVGSSKFYGPEFWHSRVA